MNDTIHRIVTERMIAALERGTVPWHKPWQAAIGRPRSMSTGQPYRGANVFLLGLTASEQGYSSPYWGTYRQISGLGGQVRKGERSTLVVFWKQAEITERDRQTGELAVKKLPVLRYYRVFNAAQAGHLPERFCPAPSQDAQITAPQGALDRYLACGPTLHHVAGDNAFYLPGTDTIRLPLQAQFRSPEHYYATAFHEAAHSTGHPDRLNRPGIADFDHFGSGKYAREELVAQMTSSMLCAQTGIDTPEIFGNSASYIAGWLHALNNDERLVISAAAHAQRACDLINQPERESAIDSDRYIEAAPTGANRVPVETRAAAVGPRQAIHGPRQRVGDTSDRCEPPAQPSVTAVPGSRSSTAPTSAAEVATARPAPVPGKDRSQDRTPQAPMRPNGAEVTGQSQDPTRTGDWQAELG
jgi:antirestriction protein ArdC